MIRIQLSKLLGEKRLTQADIARMTGTSTMKSPHESALSIWTCFVRPSTAI